ncbi:MAG: hypothetical protein JRN15_16560 [Nitrososphaerota archaeon]|nr:hypothetical protein [Nitrososphaerota archaeon]
MSVQPGKSQGSKIVLAKLPREEYTRFQQYAERNGETINASVRRLVLTEVDRPRLKRVAGKSVFKYDKTTDRFAWLVSCDDGTEIKVEDSLNADSLEQLSESLGAALNERNVSIRKSQRGSVAFPTKLERRKK